MKTFSIITSLIFIASGLLAQVPASEQNGKVLIINGTAHLGNGKVIKNSAIGMEGGKITMVADANVIRVDTSQYDQVIDASNKHIYPGFIAPNSTLGLVEVSAVRASRDFQEVGEFLPHTRALIAYNPESNIIPTVRTNGVLLAQATPRGGIISGTSSIMELDGWNWEDAVYKIDDGVHLNWPKMFKRKGWWAEPGPVKKDKEIDENLRKIRRFFEDAKAYCQISQKEHQVKNLRFEAMRGVFDGTQNLYIHADFVKSITQAVNFARDLEIPKMVLIGGYDSWMLTDMLKENKIAVILRRVHALPSRPEDDIDLPFKLPYLLQKAGVLYCINNSGSMEAMGTRNLPFYAGTAVAYGLSKEEALSAITYNTARILGIDKSVGSIEEGKDATLFISTGDALDMRSNQVEQAFIRGRQIDLDNHQKQLYKKYREKYSKEG